MDEFDPFARQIRRALQAEAESGPEYSSELHERVMRHLTEVAREEGADRSQPLPQGHARRPLMIMMLIAAVLALFLIVALFVR